MSGLEMSPSRGSTWQVMSVIDPCRWLCRNLDITDRVSEKQPTAVRQQEENVYVPPSYDGSPSAITEIRLYGVEPLHGKWHDMLIDYVRQSLTKKKVQLIGMCDSNGVASPNGPFCRDLIIKNYSLKKILTNNDIDILKPVIPQDTMESKNSTKELDDSDAESDDSFQSTFTSFHEECQPETPKHVFPLQPVVQGKFVPKPPQQQVSIECDFSSKAPLIRNLEDYFFRAETNDQKSLAHTPSSESFDSFEVSASPIHSHFASSSSTLSCNSGECYKNGDMRHKKLRGSTLKKYEEVEKNESKLTELSVESSRSHNLNLNIDAKLELPVRGAWVHVSGAPVRATRELQLDVRIESIFNTFKYSKERPVQLYSYQAILQGLSTVIVGRAGVGKSYGYIVPLMTKLLHIHDKRSAPRGYGPLAIIVCADSEKAKEIHFACSKFANFSVARGQAHTRIVLACGGSGEEYDLRVQERVVEGSEVLVTTPSWVARNVKFNIIVCLERLQFIALDDCDVLLEPPHDAAIRVLRKASQHLRRDQHVQWVLTGETWSTPLQQVVRSMDDKNITALFNNFLEAARYTGLQPTMKFCKDEEKIEHILEYMKDVVQKNEKSRIAVVCRGSEEVEGVASALSAAGWPVISPDPFGTQITFPKDVTDRTWREARDAVLVCSDWQLEHLKSSDANVIINYSLPVGYYSCFAQRFTLAAENLSIELPITCDQMNEHIPKLQTLILIDESSQIQLPMIIEKFNFSKTPQMLELTKKLREARDIEEKRLFLCDFLVGRGKCPIPRNKCRFSHTVRTSDRPLPTHQGIAVFKPVCSLDGATFGARILQTTDAMGNRHEFADIYSDFHDELQTYFSDPNRPGLGSQEVGTYCAVQLYLTGQDEFEWHRAQILRPKEKKVLVRLIDFGLCRSVQEYDMRALPDEFIPPNLPPLAVTVYIMGIAPCDFDLFWSQEARSNLSRVLLKTELSPNSRWQGRIRFAFDGKLVMDKVQKKNYLKIIKSYVTEIDVGEVMLQGKYAVTNPQHLELLAKTSEGILAPIPVIEKRRKIPAPTWAYLEGDLPEVFLSTGESTDCIFFTIKKFEDLLDNLEKECTREGEEKKRRKFKVHKGDLCLVEMDPGKWGRGRIEQLNEDGTAMCFFVDHGDISAVPLTSCVSISNKLITKLPFQAIECRLGGIEHDISNNDGILDLLQFDFTDDAMLASSLIYQISDQKPRLTRGTLYIVNVLNSEGRSFNKMLVDEGHAKAAADAAEYLMDIDVLVASNNDEADDEDYDEAEREEREEDIPELDDVKVENSFACETFLRCLQKLTGDEEVEYEFLLSKQIVEAAKPIVESELKTAVANKLEAAASEGTENATRTEEETDKLSAKVTNKDSDKNGRTENAMNSIPLQNKEILNPQLPNLSKPSEQDTEKPPDAITPVHNCSCTHFLTPRAYWTQDRDTVRFRFEIIGADEQNLRLFSQQTRFTLICPTGQSVYRARLILWSLVWAEDVKITVTPFDVRLRFRKKLVLQRSPWPRPYFEESPLNTRFLAEIEEEKYYELPSEYDRVECGENLLFAGAESDSSVEYIEDQYE